MNLAMLFTSFAYIVAKEASFDECAKSKSAQLLVRLEMFTINCYNTNSSIKIVELDVMKNERKNKKYLEQA